MSLRFSRLDRLAIRKLLPGKRITEHGIKSNAWPMAISDIQSMSWSMACASIA